MSTGHTGAVAAALFILVILVAGAVFAINAVVSPDDSDYDPVAEHPEFFTQPEPAPAPAEPVNYAVSAEIGAQCDGVSYGSRWFLLEYRNTGQGPIAFPKIAAKLYDAQGEFIRDVEAGSNVYALPAGESAWLHTTLPKEAASATFTIAVPERVKEYTPAVSRLALAEFTYAPNATMKGYTDLNGRVKNTHNRSLSTVLVQAIGFDANERPCAYALVYTDSKVIAPGATSSFSVVAGTRQVSEPTRWEIHAWGVVEK